VNEGWCTDCGLVKSCQPYYLPREFTAVLVTIVYIPLGASGNEALKELYDTVSSLQMKHPEAFYVVAGNFNHVKLTDTLLSFYQHVIFLILCIVRTLTFMVRTELFLAPILASLTTFPSCWCQHIVR